VVVTSTHKIPFQRFNFPFQPLKHHFTILFSLFVLRRMQRVVGDVHLITLEIETANHDIPLLGLSDMMSIKSTKSFLG